jgi:hypothetical protein
MLLGLCGKETVTPRVVLLVVVLVLVLGGFFAAPKVIQLIKGGPVIGPDLKVGSDRAIGMSPVALLAEVNAALAKMGKPSVNLDQLALARSLRSEHGNDSIEVRRWVAWAVRNAAGGPSRVFAKLTTKVGSPVSGKFADQSADGRYAATGQGARLVELELARDVLSAAASADPTGGATNFFSPRAQDALRRRALAGDPSAARTKKDAAELRASWLASGLVSRGAPAGTPSGLVEFFAGRVA